VFDWENGLSFPGFLLIAFIVTLGIFSLAKNQDTFSPAKFYLASFFVFFGGGAIGDWSLGTWFLASLIGIMAAYLLVLEPRSARARVGLKEIGRCQSKLDRPPVQISVILFIWVITLPALIAQAFLVDSFGGIEEYVNVLGHRVQEFRGYGPITTIASTFLVIHLIYFGYLLRCKTSPIHWVGFLLHFTLLVGVGILTSSRGGILNAIALLLIIFHYQRRPVSIPIATFVAAMLILFAGVLGTIRENLKIEDGQVQTGLDFSDSIFKEGTLSSGMIALEVISNTDRELRYGSTFISIFTNAIPREWWPNKPDTGGVVFTYEYTLDEWRGLSNLTPTLIGEFIINFGWVIGVGLFVIVYGRLMIVLIRFYQRIRDATTAKLQPDDLFFSVIFYVLFLWMVAALMIGEATNTITPFFFTKFVPLLIIRFLFGYFGFVRLESSMFNPNRMRSI
jgi:oligosaccharide repeat unit polymerase